MYFSSILCLVKANKQKRSEKRKEREKRRGKKKEEEGEVGEAEELGRVSVVRCQEEG